MDSDLEYFPDDGYDYNQHFAKPELYINSGWFHTIDDLEEKKKNPVFNGTLEKNFNEMTPEERDLIEAMNSDEEDLEEAEDDEFFESFVPASIQEKEALLKTTLWRPTEFELPGLPPTPGYMPAGSDKDSMCADMSDFEGNDFDLGQGAEGDGDSDFEKVLAEYGSDDDFDDDEDEEQARAQSIAILNQYTQAIKKSEREHSDQEDPWKLTAEKKEIVMRMIQAQQERGSSLETETETESETDTNVALFLNKQTDRGKVKKGKQPATLDASMFAY